MKLILILMTAVSAATVLSRESDFGGGSGPIISNHQMTDSSTVSEGSISSGLMGVPGANDNPPQDAEAELDGTIKNATSGVRKISDVKIWFEKLDGTKITTPSGGAPVSALKTAGGSGTPNDDATLAGTSNGVATFNLADEPSPGALVSYEAQVDHFVEPNNYKVKMAFSSRRASSSVHFDCIGLSSFTDAATIFLDGIAPTFRQGVVLGVRNLSTSQLLSKVKIILISNDSGLAITGATVADTEDVTISGYTTSIENDGTELTIGDLALEEDTIVNVWVELNASYTEETVFKVSAQY